MGTKNMAAEMNTVVEGPLKYREGKKWKPRWCVIKKPSPVADQLLVNLYKDRKDVMHKDGHPKSTFPVEDFYGLETTFTLDKENHVMGIICQKNITVFAFDHRENMLHFQICIRASLGEDYQYCVRLTKIPSHSKLSLDTVRLHIQGQKFCMTAGIPPKLLISWNLSDLRRFGLVDGKMVFEGGSRCGKGLGVHAFMSEQAEEINEILQLASIGKIPPRRLLNKRVKPGALPAQYLSRGFEGRYLDFCNLQVKGDHNFRVDELERSKRHSVGVLDYHAAAEIVEKQRLMSIENVDKERLTRLYDIPPQRVRKVENDDTIPEVDSPDSLTGDVKYEAVHLANFTPADSDVSDGNTEDRRQRKRDSGDGKRRKRNSGDGSRSDRNSSNGNHSNRNSGNGNRSNRNSGNGNHSSRNSGDGNESNHNDSGDNSRSNRSKRNSTNRHSGDSGRSNRYSSDSSRSSKSSGDGSHYRSRRYSGEGSRSRRNSDVAHRSSLALRHSLDNILAGNTSQAEDVDSEFKENSLRKNQLNKKLTASTSALHMRISEQDNSNRGGFAVNRARAGSVPLLIVASSHRFQLCEGNRELEKLTREEEKLKRELELLDEIQASLQEDEMIQETDKNNTPDIALDFQTALAGLNVDTSCTESDTSKQETSGRSTDGALLSPGLSSKLSRIPSCSRLAAPLPYVNLDEYDGTGRTATTDHVDMSRVPPPIVRRGLSHDNLSSNVDAASRSKSLSGFSGSSGSSISLTPEGFIRRPPPLPPKLVSKDQSPPPELPPKGPNLLRRQKGTSKLSKALLAEPMKEPANIAVDSQSSSSHYSSMQYQTPRSVPITSGKPKAPLPDPEDSYMLMSDFLPKEKSVMTLDKSVLLPLPEDAGLDFDDPRAAYMDMAGLLNISPTKLPKSASGQLNLPPTKLPKCASSSELYNMDRMAQKVLRSQSVRTAGMGLRPKLIHSHSAEPCLNPHNNYMEMSAGNDSLLENCIQPLQNKGDNSARSSPHNTPCTTLGESEPVKTAWPFSDLITVDSYRSNQTVELAGTVETANNNNNNENSAQSDKLDTSSLSKTSFFARFIQRTKSKDRKSSISSQDSLLGEKTQNTVPSAYKKGKEKRRMSSSHSSSASRSSSVSCQDDLQSLELPVGADRQRSSSVPNETFFLESIKRGANSSRHTGSKTSLGQIDKHDKRGSKSEDTLSSLMTTVHEQIKLEQEQDNDEQMKTAEQISNYFEQVVVGQEQIEFDEIVGLNCEVELEKNDSEDIRELQYGSYWRMTPLDITCTSTSRESTSSEMSHQNPENMSVSSDEVFSVSSTTQNSSQSGLAVSESTETLSPQTDDEKLQALLLQAKLWSSLDGLGHSLISDSKLFFNDDQKLTPQEQAAAIAKHVTALPPFIPPKTKTLNPSNLVSADEESGSSADIVTDRLPSSNDNHGEKAILSHPRLASLLVHQPDPASMKRLARETLRITPPVEDENGNIWIPRGASRKSEPVNGHGSTTSTVGDGMNTAGRRQNDGVNEVKDHLDALSLSSSHGSSTGSPGIRVDDTHLRSSPAATILRPRSGKEYHRIDRRRLTGDEHSQTSSPSPQSPSAASIFTFDPPSSPSVCSIISQETESPAGSPSFMRSAYPYHSYVNIGKGPDNRLIETRPNLYVNVDMTPSSPFRRCTHLPLEQIDPQLNYAEIDLSQNTSDRSRKSSKKTVQKAATIEYAMIDMVATAAVSKARKEHAASREDSLRRSARKFSAPASVITKERRTLGGGSFREKDRNRKLSTSSVDSNG